MCANKSGVHTSVAIFVFTAGEKSAFTIVRAATKTVSGRCPPQPTRLHLRSGMLAVAFGWLTSDDRRTQRPRDLAATHLMSRIGLLSVLARASYWRWKAGAAAAP